MAEKKTKPRTKCEFDKESMYSKIMPTAAKRAEEDAEANDPLQEMNEVLKEAAGKRSMAVAKDKKVSSTSGIQIVKPEIKTVLINITEVAVNRRINEAFAKFKCCKCDRCMKDVAAIALNKLPVKYMVVEEDKVDELADACSQDVVPALVSAVMVVKTNPRH